MCSGHQAEAGRQACELAVLDEGTVVEEDARLHMRTLVLVICCYPTSNIIAVYLSILTYKLSYSITDEECLEAMSTQLTPKLTARVHYSSE